MRRQQRVEGTADGSLEDARRRFERWRKGCQSYGRIPHELWQVAASVALVHGAELTAARLELDVGRLKEWMASLGEDGEAAEPARSVEFVELPPLNSSAPECTLELEEPSGRKLRISLHGPATKQVLELGRMLWRSPP